MRKIAAIVLLAAIWTPIDRAEAHDWFSLQCCSGMDCREIPASAVTEAAFGIRAWLSGEEQADLARATAKEPTP